MNNLSKIIISVIVLTSIILLFTFDKDIHENEYKVISHFYNNFNVNLDSLFCKYFIIINSTDSSKMITDKVKQKFFEKFGLEIDSTLIKDYNFKNNKSWDLEHSFNFQIEYKLINKTELDSIFTNYFGWPEFYNRFPEACGYKYFSRVGFNDSNNKAIFFVKNIASGLAGSGSFIYMEKQGEKWIEIASYQVWIS